MYIHVKPIPEGAECDATKDHKDCGEEAVTGVFPYEHIYVCRDHSTLIGIGMIPDYVKGRFDKLEEERKKELK